MSAAGAMLVAILNPAENNSGLHAAIVIQDENNTVPWRKYNAPAQSSIRIIEEDLVRKMGLDYVSVAANWGSEQESASKGYMAHGVHPSDFGGRNIARIQE